MNINYKQSHRGRNSAHFCYSVAHFHLIGFTIAASSIAISISHGTLCARLGCAWAFSAKGSTRLHRPRRISQRAHTASTHICTEHKILYQRPLLLGAPKANRTRRSIKLSLSQNKPSLRLRFFFKNQVPCVSVLHYVRTYQLCIERT